MTKEQAMIEQIKHIVKLCEEVQTSHESRYTKECAVITAYEQIREIVKGEQTNDRG